MPTSPDNCVALLTMPPFCPLDWRGSMPRVAWFSVLRRTTCRGSYHGGRIMAATLRSRWSGGARQALMLALVFSFASAPASAAGVHAELGFAASGLLGLGDFGKVSGPSVGGEGTFQLLSDELGIGLRVAGGMRLLRGYSIPTGEVIFNGTGTQPGKFEAKQSVWWIALGPAWSRPIAVGRIGVHLVAGKALASASSGLGWSNTLGADPGKTSFMFAQAGITWSPQSDQFDLGADVLLGGSADYWDDPPVIVDGAGAHVLQSQTASYTGVVFRVGYHIGG